MAFYLLGAIVTERVCTYRAIEKLLAARAIEFTAAGAYSGSMWPITEHVATLLTPVHLKTTGARNCVADRALPHVSHDFIDTIPTFGYVTYTAFEKIYTTKCRATAAADAHFGAPFARNLRTITAYLDAPTIFDPADNILTIWTYSTSGLEG